MVPQTPPQALNTLWYHCDFVTSVAIVAKVAKLQMKQKQRPTQNQRIALDNIKRLKALSGKLQWECGGDDKSIDDAIDCLFDCKEQLEKMLKETREKTNAS